MASRLSRSIASSRRAILSIKGPSGVGKSTLLAFVTGTLSRGLTGMGRIILDGRDIGKLPANERRIGILFQDDLLFPHLALVKTLHSVSVIQAVAANDEKKIESNLAELGLPGFYDRDPATLSGGQASRVQLLRTLLADPKALLLDEAFSRLDAELRQQVRRLVFDHAKERNLPVLMVTHDAEDAIAAGGKIIELSPY